jgi:DhnA family fructose-bisphosphate aldolase class Ia
MVSNKVQVGSQHSGDCLHEATQLSTAAVDYQPLSVIALPRHEAAGNEQLHATPRALDLLQVHDTSVHSKGAPHRKLFRIL